MKQGSEFSIFFKKEFICSAALATVREIAVLGEYLFLFNILFSKNIFVQLQYAKECSAKF
jgi:hypothetical protein